MLVLHSDLAIQGQESGRTLASTNNSSRTDRPCDSFSRIDLATALELSTRSLAVGGISLHFAQYSYITQIPTTPSMQSICTNPPSTPSSNPLYPIEFPCRRNLTPCPLSPSWQTHSMSSSSIASHIPQSPDVVSKLPSQIVLDCHGREFCRKSSDGSRG